MTKTKLRNFLQQRGDKNRELFCKQINKRVSLLQKSRKKYFAMLNEKSITDINAIWKTFNHFLSKKSSIFWNNNLTEVNDSSLTNCEEVAKELDNSFVNAVKNLNIPYYENYDSLTENINDATLKPIVKCRNHSSILVTASEYESTANFSFNFISKEAVHAEKYLISRKLVKTIKTNDNFFAEAIFYHFNKSLENGKFYNCLKLANITPVF